MENLINLESLPQTPPATASNLLKINTNKASSSSEGITDDSKNSSLDPDVTKSNLASPVQDLDVKQISKDVIEINGARYMKLNSISAQLKFQNSTEKVFTQLTQVKQALNKTFSYIQQKHDDLDLILKTFCEETGLDFNQATASKSLKGSLKRSASPSSGQNSSTDNKRSKEQSSEDSTDLDANDTNNALTQSERLQQVLKLQQPPKATPPNMILPSPQPSQNQLQTVQTLQQLQHHQNLEFQRQAALAQQQAIAQQSQNILNQQHQMRLHLQKLQETNNVALNQQVAAAQQILRIKQNSGSQMVPGLHSPLAAASNPDSEQVSRYWNDAMYRLIVNASNGQNQIPAKNLSQMQQEILARSQKQAQVTSVKVPNTPKKKVSASPKIIKKEPEPDRESPIDVESSPKKSSDSKDSEIEVENKKEHTGSKQQVKPQWIVKRMEKLRSQREEQKENGELPVSSSQDELDLSENPFTLLAQGSTNSTNSLPEVLSMEDDDMDVDVDAEQANPFEGSASAADVLSLVQQNKQMSKVTGSEIFPLKDPKSYQINCKQCRWTLRKWENWAKKRNEGKLPWVSDTEVKEFTAPTDFLTLIQTKDLVLWMSKFIQEIRKDNGEAYQIDSITAFAFSLQKVLKETGRQIDILRNEKFVPFLEAMNSAIFQGAQKVLFRQKRTRKKRHFLKNF